MNLAPQGVWPVSAALERLRQRDIQEAAKLANANEAAQSRELKLTLEMQERNRAIGSKLQMLGIVERPLPPLGRYCSHNLEKRYRVDQSGSIAESIAKALHQHISLHGRGGSAQVR
jgi:hypothetical protein